MKLAAGDLAPELLGSVNARPAALERAGYDFEDEDVRERAGRRARLIARLDHQPPTALSAAARTRRVEARSAGSATGVLPPTARPADDPVGDHAAPAAYGVRSSTSSASTCVVRPVTAQPALAVVAQQPYVRGAGAGTGDVQLRSAAASPSAHAAARRCVPRGEDGRRSSPGGDWPSAGAAGRWPARSAGPAAAERHHQGRHDARAGDSGEGGQEAAWVHPATLAETRRAAGVLHRP